VEPCLNQELENPLYNNISDVGAPAGRGQNKVRTFWENTVDEIEIPIFDIPLQRA